jgi:hypothetical protein
VTMDVDEVEVVLHWLFEFSCVGGLWMLTQHDSLAVTIGQSGPTKVDKHVLVNMCWHSGCITCFSRLINAALLLGITGCPPNFSAPRTPKAHLWSSGSVGQVTLPTAAKVVQLGWEFS